MPITQIGIVRCSAASLLVFSGQSRHVFGAYFRKSSCAGTALQILMPSPTTMKPVFFFFALCVSFFSTRASALTFSEWLAQNFTTDQLSDQTVSGPAADPDNDSFCNLLEFAYHSSPKNPDSNLIVYSRQPDGKFYFEVPWHADRPLLIIMEYSKDLVTWTSGIDLTQYSIVDSKLVAADLNPLTVENYRFRRLAITAIETGIGDSDGDGLDDEYEMSYFGDIAVAHAFQDSDGDGILNVYEQKGMRDTDSEDGNETWVMLNAFSADSDGDGINDDVELFRGADPVFSGAYHAISRNIIYIECELIGGPEDLPSDFGSVQLSVQYRLQYEAPWKLKFRDGSYIAAATLAFKTPNNEPGYVQLKCPRASDLMQHGRNITYGTIKGGHDFAAMGVSDVRQLESGIYEFTNVPISISSQSVFMSCPATAEFAGPNTLKVGEWSSAGFGFRGAAPFYPSSGMWAWTSMPVSVNVTCNGSISLTDRFGNDIGKVISLNSPEAIESWLNIDAFSLNGKPAIGIRGNRQGLGSITVRTKTRTKDASFEHLVMVEPLLPIEIIEVISDQIADNDANKLPTEYFKGEPNNPMLMATRNGQKAKLRVKVASPIDPKVYVGARINNTHKILGFVSVTSETVSLEIDVPTNSHNIYEIVGGYDLNANLKLDDHEVLTTFKKTPLEDSTGDPVTDPQNILDRLIIVDENQAGSSLTETIGYGNFIGTSYAGELLDAFAKGATEIPNTIANSPETVSPKQPGLSHPVGAKWNASNHQTTHRFTYTDGSPTSNDVESSEALAEIVTKIITDKKQDMLAYTGIEEWPVSTFYNLNESIDFMDTESLFDNVLGPAFGKIEFVGKLRVRYKKLNATTIRVEGVEVVGTFDDLYDFAYGGSKFWFIWFSFDPREPVMVQAGHATLSKAPHPNAGKVFFARVEYNTGFTDTWNGDY